MNIVYSKEVCTSNMMMQLTDQSLVTGHCNY